MKRTRKGFTLIELLVVIAIMGILSAVGLIGAQEATSAARATQIAGNLEKLSTAAMMFYAENAAEIDKSGTLDGSTAFTATILAGGINAYLKAEDAIADASDGGFEEATNTYFAAVGTETGASKTWWVGYKFGTSDGNTQIQRAMVNKVNRMKLKKTAGDTAYDGEAIVYMKVR